MAERDVELVLQRARELYPNARPRLIFDNGPQFVAKDFKEFIRLAGMTHVRTSPYHPQSNGKLERFHYTFKDEGWRPMTPLDPDDGRKAAADFIRRYNTERLHSGIGYVTPLDRAGGTAHTDFRRARSQARRRSATSRPAP